MNEQRKNPFRRPPTSDERRPGLRQLPKDFDDLATGKTERLRRPRKAPAPLHDEREGAVIAGVRNMEARTVYDARVRSLRQHLADGRHAELQAGLEAARQMRLWRARNVTDFRAFVESVVGLSQEQAAALSVSDEPDAARLPDHVIALAVRLEAALLAHAKNATVALRVDDAGELKLSLELPVVDVHRAVDAVEDAGRAVSGLRYFLRDDERPRGYGDRDGAAGGGDRRPTRERRDDHWSERRERDAGERRLPRREDARAEESASAQRELDASAVIESAIAAAGGESARADFGDDQPVQSRSRFADSDDANEPASVDGSSAHEDDDFGDDASARDRADEGARSDDQESVDESDGDESDNRDSDEDKSTDDESAVDRSDDADDDDESDDDESDGDESDDDESDADTSDSSVGEPEDVAAAEGDAGSRPLARGRARDAGEGGERDAGSRPFGRREGGAFSRGGGDDRGASRGPGRDQTFGSRDGGDAGQRGFAGNRERRDFGNRGSGNDRGFGRDRERGNFGNRGGDDRNAGPRGFGRGPNQGGDQRGFGRGREQGTFDRRGPDDQSSGSRGFGAARFEKRGGDDRDAPRFGGQGERRDSGPGRFGRDREQGGFDKRDGGPGRFGAGRDQQGGFNDRGGAGNRERGGFNDRGRDDRNASPRFGRGGDDRNAGSGFARGPKQGFDKRGPDDRGPKGKSFGKPKGGPKKFRK